MRWVTRKAAMSQLTTTPTITPIAGTDAQAGDAQAGGTQVTVDGTTRKSDRVWSWIIAQIFHCWYSAIVFFCPIQAEVQRYWAWERWYAKMVQFQKEAACIAHPSGHTLDSIQRHSKLPIFSLSYLWNGGLVSIKCGIVLYLRLGETINTFPCLYAKQPVKFYFSITIRLQPYQWSES